MAFRREIMKRTMKRGLLTAVLAFFFASSVYAAAPSAPGLGETDWSTGELEVCWTGVTPGNAIILYVRTYNQTSFAARDTWTAETSSGCRMTSYYENGQTIFHYIVQVDADTGEISEPSPIVKQTPPITAFIINWPDMYQQLKDLLTGLNNDLKNKLDQLATPSPQAQADLQDAVNALKDAVGAGAAQGAGNALTNGLNGMQSGMATPGVDDGVGTYTGGHSGPNLPNSSHTDGLGLVSPNLDEGTDTELTMRIPIGVKMDGSLMYIKLFTQEQMEKLKWIFLIRTIAAAVIYIMFGIYLVYRFAPQLKS